MINDTTELVGALDEFVTLLQRGEKITPPEFAASYPHLGSKLLSYLESLNMFQQVAAETEKSVNLDETLSGDIRQPIPVSSSVVGEFRLIRELGRGGMGIVYEAIQQSLERRVALKVLPCATAFDPRQVSRFRAEAQTAANLHHPHIVPVHSFGCAEGVYYYSMQLIDGKTLDQVIDETHDEEAPSALSEDVSRFTKVAELGVQAAQALHFAHEQGVIHRDVKPSNLLVNDHGHLWISDFGLARWQGNEGVTQSGAIVGTARYMSPEQAAGETQRLDRRTDVYSLGVTLYELFTRTMFLGDETGESILWRVRFSEPILPRLIEPRIPRELETIILKAIAKDRNNRYATARDMAADLERFLKRQPIHARRPTVWHRLGRWIRARQSQLVLMTTVAAAAALAGSYVTRVYPH